MRTRGEGVKEFKIFVDIISGSSLSWMNARAGRYFPELFISNIPPPDLDSAAAAARRFNFAGASQ